MEGLPGYGMELSALSLINNLHSKHVGIVLKYIVLSMECRHGCKSLSYQDVRLKANVNKLHGGRELLLMGVMRGLHPKKDRGECRVGLGGWW